MDGSSAQSPLPGQCWLGTDKYTTLIPKLSSITTLKYWAILDYMGADGQLTPGAPTGTQYSPEYTTTWLASQPPQVQLHIKPDPIQEPDRWGVLIYRPWDDVQAGAYTAFGPTDGSRSRKWREYDCLAEGNTWLFVDCAYFDQASQMPQQFFTWSDFLSSFPDAVLATPPAPSSTATGYPNRFPLFGTPEAPTYLTPTATYTTGTSLNIVLGARSRYNAYFPMPYYEWSKESYNGQACLDYIQIGYDNGTNIVNDAYDFQASYATTNIAPEAMTIKSIISAGNYYAPVPRTRAWLSPDGRPLPADWWGSGAVDATKQNPIQKTGTFNYQTRSGVNKGAQYVVFGWVSNTNGDLFKIDDGSGQKLDCYCPNRPAEVADGKFVRLIGTVYGQNPYEWFYNTFHIVKWDDDPAKRQYSSLWPLRFDTYAWNATVLSE